MSSIHPPSYRNVVLDLADATLNALSAKDVMEKAEQGFLPEIKASSVVNIGNKVKVKMTLILTMEGG